jgi:hypothetical protein
MIFSMRCFPAPDGWPLKTENHLAIFDAGEHRIFGVAQAQSTDQTLTFRSQNGFVRLSDLPKLS